MRGVVSAAVVAVAGAAVILRQRHFERRVVAGFREQGDEITRAFQEVGRGFEARDKAFAKLIRELGGEVR